MTEDPTLRGVAPAAVQAVLDARAAAAARGSRGDRRCFGCRLYGCCALHSPTSTRRKGRR